MGIEERGYSFFNLRTAITALKDQVQRLEEYAAKLEEVYAEKNATTEEYGLERFIALQDFNYKSKQHKKGDIVLITAKEVADKGFIALGYLKREAK